MSKTTVKQAIDSFLLSYRVEGKSYGTVECYTGKLEGFRLYGINYDYPDIIDLTKSRLLPILPN